MTTTETESREALHLWLAERLSELQEKCRNCGGFGRGIYHREVFLGKPWPIRQPDMHVCPKCFERGWMPNVSTDALLEALARKGMERVNLLGGHHWSAEFLDFGEVKGYGAGATPFEALCRAARKALEAAS